MHSMTTLYRIRRSNIKCITSFSSSWREELGSAMKFVIITQKCCCCNIILDRKQTFLGVKPYYYLSIFEPPRVVVFVAGMKREADAEMGPSQKRTRSGDDVDVRLLIPSKVRTVSYIFGSPRNLLHVCTPEISHRNVRQGVSKIRGKSGNFVIGQGIFIVNTND
jgi:hypothetical protein